MRWRRCVLASGWSILKLKNVLKHLFYFAGSIIMEQKPVVNCFQNKKPWKCILPPVFYNLPGRGWKSGGQYGMLKQLQV